ncbi:uncharacterized protein LOC105694575 isoform X2 [Orussus abietinus]|uniref:uncharacterized protein LOC105694575 isoform X2 n=1 Tax=Orussus abietinus TaxID=222816 RepID=UPI000626C92F|nr:uncharacterized protein LOC105694575 isoform X2 [Orussus abietinus]
MFPYRRTTSKGTIEFRPIKKCIAIGVGMFEEFGAPEEMIPLFKEVIKDSCSIVAVHLEKQQVVAVAFNKLHVPLNSEEEDPFSLFIQENIKHASCLGLINFINNIESKVDLFEKYDVSAILEIFYMGTDSEYRGCGIGQELVEATIKFVKCLAEGKVTRTEIGENTTLEEVKPEVVFGVFASNFSQRIAEKFNFTWLATISYDEYLHEGKKLSERIGSEHKTARLGAIKVQQ